jgi:hypothetical protein
MAQVTTQEAGPAGAAFELPRSATELTNGLFRIPGEVPCDKLEILR